MNWHSASPRGKTVNKEILTELGKSLIERFHFKICKQIIGVNKKR